MEISALNLSCGLRLQGLSFEVTLCLLIITSIFQLFGINLNRTVHRSYITVIIWNSSELRNP